MRPQSWARASVAPRASHARTPISIAAPRRMVTPEDLGPPGSLHLEPKPLFTDLELHHRFDRDLRHAQPEAVIGPVVLDIPAPLGVEEPGVPRLAERVIGAANGAARVGPDPIFGLDEQRAVADLLAK